MLTRLRAKFKIRQCFLCVKCTFSTNTPSRNTFNHLVGCQVNSDARRLYQMLKIILCHELWIWYYRIWILPRCEYDATDWIHGILSHVFSNWLPEMRHSHTCCICLAFLHCAFSNVASTCLPEKMHNHTGCICVTFLHYAFSPQMASLRRGIVTLIAFVWFFSSVCF